MAILPASGGYFSPLGLSADGAVAVGLSTTQVPAFERVTTVDLASGAVRRGSLVLDVGQLVALGAVRAYVEPRTMHVTADGYQVPGGRTPAPLQIRDLRGDAPLLERTVDLPLPFGDALAPESASSTVDWVGETGAVAEVDVETGRVVRVLHLPERHALYTVSFLGSRLYAMASATGTDPMQVVALDLPSGRIVGTRDLAGVGGSVLAVPTGAWVSYRTGMLGSAVLLSYPRLATVSPPPPSTRSEAPLPGSGQAMGVSVTVSGSTAWLADLNGVACASASTGAVRGVDAFRYPYGGFSLLGAADHHLYALTGDRATGGSRVVVVDAPGACW